MTMLQDIEVTPPAETVAAFSIRSAAPFLVAEFDAPQNMLSWSLTRPGFVVARSVVWLEVRDGDLPVDIDPAELLRDRMARAGHGEAVHLMTSRSLAHHDLASATAGSATSTCLATVGLSNASRIGEAFDGSAPIGTINLLAHVDTPLTEAARLEALSIATEARTAAIIDLGLKRDGRTVTGTGTDCVVIACPQGAFESPFAGLHTQEGVCLGRAVYDAVKAGGLRWIEQRRSKVHTTLSPP